MRQHWIVMVCVAAVAMVAHADDEGPVEIHGFVSQGFLKSTDNNFLADSERGSFEFTEAGINFTKPVSDRLRVGLQLFSRDLGPIGDYKVKLDWAYLDYRWRDWLGIRAGRTKLPFGLYNDTSDIDAAQPTALLPQSVYPATNRDFLLAQTGVELYGDHPIGSLGALDYRAYVGTIFIDLGLQPPNSPIQIAKLTIPYVFGTRVMWETPLEGLRVGGSVQRLRLETELLDARDASMPRAITADIPATLAVGSLEYARNDFLFAAEYARWYTRVETSDPTVIPATRAISERMYGLAAYRAQPWLQVAGYYSLYYPTLDDRAGPSARQHDVATTVRFDITPNWCLKLEGHHMRGTASLSSSLNPGHTLDQLANRWLLFVAKTTVYF